MTFDTIPTTTIGEPIVLKTGRSGWWDQADLMEYDDTDITRQNRKEMVEINDLLEAIGINQEDRFCGSK